MAKRRTQRQGDAAQAPMGAETGTGVEKEPYMASEKGVGDVPAVAVAAEDVVISAPIHCDGCARKLRRSLQRLDGVGDVSVDSRTSTTVMSGPGAVENAREAVRIVERKTGKKATLLNPSPEKLPLPAAKGARTKKNYAGDDVGDEIAEVDTEMVIVLRINLHCDACCEEIKRRILRIEGVSEAAPLLKSSQMMVKGMVEPATLVGFIHRSTGRKAAIIRAEPLDLLPTTVSPPMDAPLMESETKHEENASVNQGEKKDGHDKDMKQAPQQADENRGGEGDNDADEKLGTTKPSNHRGVEGHDETRHDGEDPKNGGASFVFENHKDDHLFRAPPPAEVFAVAPEMAPNKFSPYYAYPTYPYAHLHHYDHCPMPYPYASGPAMYGYSQYPHEAFSEENPNACTIV